MPDLQRPGCLAFACLGFPIGVLDSVQQFQPRLHDQAARQPETENSEDYGHGPAIERLSQINPFREHMRDGHRPAPILQREISVEQVKGNKAGPQIPESFHFRREHSRSDANHHKEAAAEPNRRIHQPNKPDDPGHRATLGKFRHGAKLKKAPSSKFQAPNKSQAPTYRWKWDAVERVPTGVVELGAFPDSPPYNHRLERTYE